MWIGPEMTSDEIGILSLRSACPAHNFTILNVKFTQFYNKYREDCHDFAKLWTKITD